MEAGKRRLSDDTMREANTTEVEELKDENTSLKELVSEKFLWNKTIELMLKQFSKILKKTT